MKKSFLWNIGSICGMALLFTLFSCDLYTNSIGEKVARDQSKVLKNASASDLAEMAAGVESANPETAVAIMELLANKTDEVKNLTIEQQEAILNLALDTTVSIGKLTDIAKPLLDDIGGSISDDDAKNMVKDILNSVNSFNTGALTTLLGDKKTMEFADPSVLANAAIASIAQVAASIDGGVDKFTNTTLSIDFAKNSPDEIVTKLLGKNGTQENKDELLVAIKVVKLLQDPTNSNGSGIIRNDIKPEDVKLLGLVSLDQILQGLGGN